MLRPLVPPLLALLLALLAPAAGAVPRAEAPRLVLHGVPFTVTVSDPALTDGETASAVLRAGDREIAILLAGGGDPVQEEVTLERGEDLVLAGAGGEEPVAVRALPGWTSLAPPLLAILLAIVFRQAVLALFTGVWLGAYLVYGANPFSALLRTFDVYVLGALVDQGHVTLLVFTFAMGGMLGILSRTGGTRGIVDMVAPRARSARSGQLSSWFMGLVVFFDDYANTLLVGNTMRPITDRLRISREKLSYIVDSTAAPVASIAIISTWIGVEVGLIASAFDAAGIEKDAFAAFVESLPYRFYPIFALAFGFLVAATGRDFGPMLKAERRARSTGETLRPGSTPLANFEGAGLEPIEGKPARWWNAAVPVAVMVAAIIVFLVTTGRSAAQAAGDPMDLKSILGNADSYSALLWASFLGSLTALILAVGQRILNVHEAVTAWVEGAKSIFMAAVILTLAWSISEVSSNMNTASFLVQRLGDTLAPHWLPVLVFLISGLTSFATGSSWGTMGILMPLVIPLAHHLAPDSALILAGTISSVLAGSVWGDHCSPISDTTVLSSMASSVDHMDHVNTQLPYALVVGIVGMAVGDIATAFGVPIWISWGVGIALLWGILRFFGRRSEAPA